MEISGTLRLIGKTEQVSDKFKKRTAVITTEGQYPQHITVEFTQDKCELLRTYEVGDSVKCYINLRGVEYKKDGQTKYFNSISVWRIERMDGSETTTPAVERSGDFVDDPF